MAENYPNIAKSLKAMRTNKGLSLDKTSKATGVSKAMLGQIERGESSPTIATVWKLATGLECSFSLLLSGCEEGEVNVELSDPQMQVVTVFPFCTQTRIEMFEISLTQFHVQHSPAHQKGVIEHIYVQQGELELLVEGHWVRLATGQSFKLNADKPHGYRDIAGHTRFTDVIYYPAKESLVKTPENS